MFNPRGNNSIPKWLIADAMLGQVALRAVVYMWPVEYQEAANSPQSTQFDMVNRPGYRWRFSFDP